MTHPDQGAPQANQPNYGGEPTHGSEQPQPSAQYQQQYGNQQHDDGHQQHYGSPQRPRGGYQQGTGRQPQSGRDGTPAPMSEISSGALGAIIAGSYGAVTTLPQWVNVLNRNEFTGSQGLNSVLVLLLAVVVIGSTVLLGVRTLAYKKLHEPTPLILAISLGVGFYTSVSTVFTLFALLSR